MPEPSGIAIFTYATQPRGGVVHAVAVAEALADRGEDVTLFALDGGRGFARAPRCPVRLVPFRRPAGDLHDYVRAGAAAYVRALERSGERRYEIYHAQDGISANALATLATDGTIPSYVRTVHHLDAFADPRVAALQDRSVARARRCAVVSDVWAGRLTARFGCVPTVVGNGVDLARFAPASASERAAARARAGVRGEEPLFVTVGGVEPRKNAVAVQEAFALVRDAHPHARLTIAGGASVFDHGTYRDAFAERTAALGLSRAVDVAGECTDDRIVDLLRAADAVVFASLAEGFGLVTLEALACGVPLVLSAIEPLTTIVPPRLAEFCDPHDPVAIAAAMCRALRPQAATNAARHGPEFAARHTWPAVAARHRTLYAKEQVLA